jgi:YfiH family protein
VQLINPIIRSSLLSRYPEIIHGMSTKLGGCEYPPYYNSLSYYVGDDEEIIKSNREKYFDTLGIDLKNLAIPKQIHSANVQFVDKPGFYRESDALITQTKNVYLLVSTADCFPILIYDKNNKAVAAVHSGWRGTQKKILSQSLDKMISEIGSRPNNLMIFIGPGISKENFEVGEDVANSFDKKFIDLRNGKFYVDLNANLLDQLDSFGIPADNIDANPLCTYKEKNYLHSYRRDRDKSGRMFAVIGLK